MQTEAFFNQIKKKFQSKLYFLNDKPEENINSTLRACWLTAAGLSVSAEEAVKQPLPELTEAQKQSFYSFIEKRVNKVPLAHITGRQHFLNIEMLSDSRALIPRKETEILGREALRLSLDMTGKKGKVHVIDVCCGSGNLGLAVAYYNAEATVFATDLSKEAVALAKDNISFLNLGQRMFAEQGNLFEALEKKDHYGVTDIIICNPPYISSAKVSKMDDEISNHEPDMAFDGGMFGTKIIQRLIGEALKFLSHGGWLLFEVGVGQGEFMMEMCKRTNRYIQVQPIADAQGNIRVITAQKNPDEQ